MGAYLHPTSAPTKEQLGLQPCTRCLVQVTCRSSCCIYRLTGDTMPLLQYRMKLRRDYRILSMVACPPYLLYNSRFDILFLLFFSYDESFCMFIKKRLLINYYLILIFLDKIIFLMINKKLGNKNFFFKEL